MKINLVSVYVSSPTEAHGFYTEVLGFTSRMYVPEAYIAIIASAEEPNGTGILLEPNDNPIAKTYQDALYSANLPGIVFSTDDIAAEYARLTSLGVAFRKEPTQTDYGIETIFEDGFGNLIQLVQA